MVIVGASAEAQFKTSVVAYVGYGYENEDNYFLSTGCEGFLETDGLFYIPSFGYVDATYNQRQTGVMPPGAQHFTESHTSRFNLGNRLEIFFPDWSMAFTLNGIIERVSYSTVTRFPPTPPPFPPSMNTSTAINTSLYLLPGAEFSLFEDDGKAGCGALLISDLQSDNKVQLYGVLSTNPLRRFSVKAYGGGLLDGKFFALGKTTASWRISVDVEAKGAVYYSRLSSVYDLDNRFLNFYREKDQWSFGGSVAYDCRTDMRIFFTTTYETNAHFDMVNVSAGLYYHP